MRKRGEIWLADLNQRRGTEPGKTRPVLLVQAQALLDADHPSTLVNPINRVLIALYRPIIRAVLNARVVTVGVALAVLAVSLWPLMRIGSEFMPTLNEGTLMYMPTTLPGLSVTKAAELVQTQNKIIKAFPEVASVFMGQGGPRPDGDRPRAARDVRDGRQPPTRKRMASRHDDRQADR